MSAKSSEMIMISDINISKKEAAQKAVESFKKKKLFGFMSQSREFSDIDEDDIAVLYFPFYVALTENMVSSKFMKESQYVLMFAVEGYTGETGVTVGAPSGKESTPDDIDDAIIVKPRITEDEAADKIKNCAVSYIMKKNRHVPQTFIRRMDMVWKPTYMVPVEFKGKDGKKRLVRFIDAESGYTVYRYDLIWKKVLEHTV